MCPECRIKTLQTDATIYGNEKAKKLLQELEKLIGKGNNDDTERETNFPITNSDC